ncbi:MAG: hypothetical protein Q4G03_04715 [Planctomycetia bacterium]|nr:hypothetical protein [Planctomycetia bacterium]
MTKNLRILYIVTVWLTSYCIVSTYVCALSAEPAAQLNPEAADRLPSTWQGNVVTPDLGCFWNVAEQNDPKEYVDIIAPWGAFDALTLTTRSNSWILNNHELIAKTKDAVAYARDKYGIKTLIDIDLRIARYDFEKLRPDLAQERLYFKEVSLKSEESVTTLEFGAPTLTDHYTGNKPYFVRGARLVQVWVYNVDERGQVIPDSITRVADTATVAPEIPPLEPQPIGSYQVNEESHNDFRVSFQTSELAKHGAKVAVAVAFRYSYPDVFADETLALQRQVYESFADVDAYGVCQDEWGFPPCFDRTCRLDDFWFSPRMQNAYAQRYDQADLVEDLFLAFRPQVGQDERRAQVIDDFNKLCSDRVLEYEVQNYELTKELWGDDVFVGVHCTWYAWPNLPETRKNGLMWWRSIRDVAQTDEYAPFCARNAMAKGTESHWINMFYAREGGRYLWEHWTALASGGRVHTHAIYPRDENSPTHPLDSRLLPIIDTCGAARVGSKIRIFNLLGDSPIDSPVAVVFSRYGAANPLRPEYDKFGVNICNYFSTAGYPADLIPVDQITATRPDGSPYWHIQDGLLCYGAQPYRLIVLYGQSQSDEHAYREFQRLFGSVSELKTLIVNLATDASDEQIALQVQESLTALEQTGVIRQTQWEQDSYNFGYAPETGVRPPLKCFSRFLDGTVLWVNAQENLAGDPIVLDSERVTLNSGEESPEISARANGLLAVRFDDDGQVNALAAAELTSFEIGDLKVILSPESVGDDPVDVALLRDENDQWLGVFQRRENVLPDELRALTEKWFFLKRW